MTMKIEHYCRSYDPIYSDGVHLGGPCWTCRDNPFDCPDSGYVIEDEEEVEPMDFKKYADPNCQKCHGEGIIEGVVHEVIPDQPGAAWWRENDRWCECVQRVTYVSDRSV
jgi:hypothetical protein